MTNDEVMTKHEARTPGCEDVRRNWERRSPDRRTTISGVMESAAPWILRRDARATIRVSSFGLPSSFVIRASSFFSRSAHARYFGQRQHAAENFFARRSFDLIDTDGAIDLKATGSDAPQ